MDSLFLLQFAQSERSTIGQFMTTPLVPKG
jgi:hypothetical protein